MEASLPKEEEKLRFGEEGIYKDEQGSDQFLYKHKTWCCHLEESKITTGSGKMDSEEKSI